MCAKHLETQHTLGAVGHELLVVQYLCVREESIMGHPF